MIPMRDSSETYAVIGNPVAHSRSPDIHAAFARQTSQSIVYKKIFCEIGQFADTVRAFRADGGKGLNITVPFKHEAFAYATCNSARAAQAGAVNVLAFDDDAVRGDNTDGTGLVRDITHNLQHELRGKDLLLLGAGGASFGVVGSLLNEQPRTLMIANRTQSKAEALVQRFATMAAGCDLAAIAYPELHGKRFDLVINATSAGLSGDMPTIPDNLCAPGALAYEMVYGRVTPFMQFAAAQGATVADGLGMLVEQAAESFLIWRGIRPDTRPVMAALRAAL